MERLVNDTHLKCGGRLIILNDIGQDECVGDSLLRRYENLQVEWPVS